MCIYSEQVVPPVVTPFILKVGLLEKRSILSRSCITISAHISLSSPPLQVTTTVVGYRHLDCRQQFTRWSHIPYAFIVDLTLRLPAFRICEIHDDTYFNKSQRLYSVAQKWAESRRLNALSRTPVRGASLPQQQQKTLSGTLLKAPVAAASLLHSW